MPGGSRLTLVAPRARVNVGHLRRHTHLSKSRDRPTARPFDRLFQTATTIATRIVGSPRAKQATREELFA